MYSDEVNLKRVLKKNAMALAKHHRKHCDGEHCTISLYLLRLMAEKAGVKFTEYQKGVFF